MQHSKRIFCILLTLVFLLSGALSACAPKAGTDTTTAAPATEPATEVPTEPATEPATEAPTEPQTEAPVFTPEADSIFASLPAYEDEDALFLGWRDMGDDSEMVVYQTPDSDGYDAYAELLKKGGFELYAENEIRGNLFSTWTDSTTDVTLMYVPSQEQTHITAEPAGDLPAPEEENVYEAVCEPLISMISVNYDYVRNNGLCFLYRLADGSFIVVDGGFNTQECADSLYKTMQKLAPDPDNIKIAAWLITHAHGDHIGGFYSFSNSYAANVTVEQFIINFPSDEAFTASDTSIGMRTKFETCLELYPGAKVIKTHPGQVFYLRDAVIEMLYTWDLFPIDDRFMFFNNSSLVFSVEIGGQKLMQLGDCGPEASPVIAAMYGDYLDSDFIQVGHHGQQGPTAELNELINPEVVLWPASKIGYNQHSKSKRNALLKTIEDLYVADKQVWVFHLPYSADTVESWDIYRLDQ